MICFTVTLTYFILKKEKKNLYLYNVAVINNKVTVNNKGLY